MSLAVEPLAQTLAATSTGEDFPVRRVFCVGRNYAAHAREMGQDPGQDPPFFFTAWAETVVPDGAVVPYPQNTSNFHHEAELVAAIGKGGRDIPVDQALDHVWGYAAGLDMTRRDLQMEARGKGRPWDIGKNIEAGSPLGRIRRAGDGFDPTSAAIELTVNGQTKQKADIGDMLWPLADVIAHLSTYYRLEPGDLIYTGTPEGVGPVVEGDEVKVTIAGLEPLNVRIGPKAT